MLLVIIILKEIKICNGSSSVFTPGALSLVHGLRAGAGE